MKHDPRLDPRLSDPATVASPTCAGSVPPPGLRPPRTMAELKTVLPLLGYSARMEAQVRPQVDHCAAVYGLPLERIPADPAAFEAKWGRGRTGPAAIPSGFRDHGHLLEFRRRLRPALARAALLGSAAGPSPLVPLGLGWDRLVAFCKENQAGEARRVPPHVHVSLGALGARAMRLGLGPADLAGEGAERLFAGAVGKERRTLRCGLRSLNKLIARRGELSEIAALLPDKEVARPAPVQRRSACPPRQDPRLGEVWAAFDGLMAAKLKGAGQPKTGGKPFTEASIPQYEAAVGDVLRAHEAQGLLGPAPRLDDLLSREAIGVLEDWWAGRVAAGEVRADATTLRMSVERLVHLAGLGPKPPKAERKARRRELRRFRGRTPSPRQMSPERLRWIKSFARSPAQQRAVHRMPEVLMRAAERILARQDRGEALAPRLRMEALELGTAAMMAAVLFRAAPVRAANLHALRHRGPDATLVLGHPSGPRVDLPAGETKAEQAFESEADEDFLPVLHWFLRRIRPRLIADHPYAEHRRAKRGLSDRRSAVDSDFLFPGPRMDTALDRTTLEERFRRGVRAAGLDLTPHQARHVSAYLILGRDPGAWAAAAEVLGVKEPTLRRHYAWLDTDRLRATGREHLRESRKEASRHRIGRALEGSARARRKAGHEIDRGRDDG